MPSWVCIADRPTDQPTDRPTDRTKSALDGFAFGGNHAAALIFLHSLTFKAICLFMS